ncbi:MAG TPA: AAA family ATPase [Streptosporangiaceae bacterium]|nr:AAA family ATPase [Streptosporangiaceae bacterium]
MSLKLARPVALCAALTIPALFLRLGGVHPAAAPGLVVFGAAVVAASFLLAWAAEAARVDISGPLAIAILAVIAVLPEYAVDLYFSYTAGHDPGYVQYAAANMTGSNRLLLGLGWPVVVITALAVASRRSGHSVRELVLQSGYRVELGFLLIASIAALVVPLSGQISLILGFALLGFFVFYLWKASQAATSDPELAGTAARIGSLPTRGRRLLVAGLFIFAAAVIVASAEPFANSLITTGTELGIDRFLLVQWVAPLASESPEFIVAILFAVHGKGSDAIGTLISSKVNQWTLLVGSLPVAYLAGGGGTALMLDARQIEEFLLTAAQTLLGVAALLTLRFPRWLAFTLLVLFAAQYALPGQAARYALAAIYGGIAVAALARNHRHILPTLAAPFRAIPGPAGGGSEAVPAPASQPSPRPAGTAGAGVEVTKAPARTQATAPAHPARLPVSKRSLVLVAGLPGAGKTTLMRTLHPDRTLRVSDSEQLRTAVLPLLPCSTRYGLVRPAVHLLHRASVVCLSLGPSPAVVVHLPATSARLRRAITRLARLSRRTAHLVWLDAAATEARESQRTRGRMITARSFERHVRRAERTSERILARQLDEGWATTLRLDRHAARAGLQIQIDDRPCRARCPG